MKFDGNDAPEAPDSNETSEQSADAILIIRTNTECTDRQLGDLLGRYVANVLSDREKSTFEEHLAQCIACDTAVVNWFEFHRAARRLFRR